MRVYAQSGQYHTIVKNRDSYQTMPIALLGKEKIDRDSQIPIRF